MGVTSFRHCYSFDLLMSMEMGRYRGRQLKKMELELYKEKSNPLVALQDVEVVFKSSLALRES